ncbi:MAG: YggS family pyridoxal phosphate-dependent enzyme [Gammaproteobacteria bacterium]
MTRITEQLLHLNSRIADAASAAGRKRDAIDILGVSKKHSAESVKKASSAGITRFGENYVQEAIEKIPLIGEDLEWHFIGRIQSNKTRLIAENFAWVQTVSNERIAARLDRQRPANMAPLQICIQVCLDPDNIHSGVRAEELSPLCEFVATRSNLRLRGLMGMPLPADDFDAQRRPFRELRTYMEDLNQQGYDLDTLSMGMSGDLEAAVHEGSTLLRIGTALFGPRNGI